MNPPPLIGVANPDLSGSFIAALMEGIHSVAQQQGAQVILCKGFTSVIGKSKVAQDHVDGWIIFNNDRDLGLLGYPNKPIVAVSMADVAELVPTILPDNWGGIKAVMEHLFEHGHEKIAFIGNLDNSDVQQRAASYRAALKARGLPVDERMVVNTTWYFQEHGRDAVRKLLETGLPFSAVVTAGDFNAFGAVEALRSAGLRVPEDVAVTGFDDVPSAQFSDPPMTSVHQRPEALGQLAARTLLTILSGQQVPPGAVFAPTAVIKRRSCGCDIAQAFIVPDLKLIHKPGWERYLVAQLVLLARHPLPLPAGTPPEQLWPGADWLVQQLSAILSGAAVPETAAFEQVWQEAITHTDKLDILHGLVKLLESAGHERLQEQADDHPTRERILIFVDRARLAMMRVRLFREEIVSDMFQQIGRVNEAIDQALLIDQPLSTTSLDWMEQTPADWACLGLWTEVANGEQPQLRIAATYQRGGGTTVKLARIYPASSFPPAPLIQAPPVIDVPTNILVLPVESQTMPWGLLAVRLQTDKQITYDLHGLKLLAPRLATKLDRDALLASLHQQQEILTQAYERERALTSTIRELGSPIIPLIDKVLLVPLIGWVDASRAQEIVEAVLAGVQRYAARVILLDVTGVPLVDTQVANSLVHTARAVKLLGSRTIMVGVRPEIAQSIVGLGIDLSQIETFPSLAAALNALIKK